MIQWELVEDTGGTQRKFWGESDAFSDSEIRSDFREFWLKIFEEQIPWYPRDSWNSFVCGATVDTGNFTIEFAIDRSLTKMKKGVSLTFGATRDHFEGEFETDEQFERECATQESRFVKLLMEAWDASRDASAISKTLADSPVALRIFNSPEEDASPLLDTILQP